MKQNIISAQAMPAFFLPLLCVSTVAAWSVRGASRSVQVEVEDSSTPTWQAMVINLDRRPDRLKHFADAIREHEPWLMDGGHLCRIKGRDGRELPRQVEADDANKKSAPNMDWTYHPTDAYKRNTQIPDSLSDDKALLSGDWVDAVALQRAETQNANWPDMTPGGIGLYLGHAAAWQQVIRKNLDYGIIFEDDLTLFAGNFADQVQSILRTETKNAAWDWLYLQRCDDEAWKKKRTSGNDANPIAEQTLWSREVKIHSAKSVPCTGAYVITQRGAEALMQEALPAHEQLDHQLTALTDLRRSALTPPIAQCQEIFRNGSWTYRDTDVQQPDQELNVNQISTNLQKFLGVGIWKAKDTSLGFLQNRVRAKEEYVVDCS